MKKPAPNLDAIAEQIRDNIAAAVGGDHVDVIAERTGIDPGRVEAIVGGELPDGYEVMAIEAAYELEIWPRNRTTLSVRETLKRRQERS